MNETIVAIATPPGEGGIGVVRLSGEEAIPIAEMIFRSKSGKKVSSQKSFTARYGCVVETSDGSAERMVDEALLLVMRSPKSYTGEDVVEISLHGGSAVLQRVVRRALQEGARLAQPGEFTKRAFLNGRMDLLQAESVLDLIHAKSDRIRSWAAGQLEGNASNKMKEWKEALIQILSHLEAAVDFPDDFPSTDSQARLAERIHEIRAQIKKLTEDSELVFIAKRGFRAALCGKPNVGKSSLMNRLTRTDRVIVTPYPGTTRDVVEVECSLAGFPVRFLDTAGIHESDHPIEKEGIERSKKVMAEADLILLVLDGSVPLEEEDRKLLEACHDKQGILVLNKSDLFAALEPKDLEKFSSWPWVACSAILERGTEDLERQIENMFFQGHVESLHDPVISTTRQKDLLEKVSKDLQRAEKVCQAEASPELAASDIRSALTHLAEMVGEVVNDDILDVIFQQFCIGK